MACLRRHSYVVLGADVERARPVDRVDDEMHGCSSAVVRTRW
jgi:hypothetical protein